jgi:hypothetical protein
MMIKLGSIGKERGRALSYLDRQTIGNFGGLLFIV